MTQRIVSGAPHELDHSMDTSLRPRRIVDYIGQTAVKNLLAISIKAAQQRGEPLDHVLLYGPPGLGKTTLANIMATEMGVRIKTTSGPAIERPGDMVATLTQMQEGDILFIDEIHRLSRVVEEVLYPAMEDFFVSWVIDKGLKARSMNLSIKPFTLIGATTRYGMLSPPLRDRFGNIHRLDFYDEDAMATIVERSARILEIQSDQEGVTEIARRARGTPRIANRLLRRVRDYAQVIGDGVITGELARTALRQPGSRRAWTRRHRHPHAPLHHRKIRGRARRLGHHSRIHQRGQRHNRGCVRAVPIAARLPRQDTARSRSYPPRLRPPRLRLRQRQPELGAGEYVLATNCLKKPMLRRSR